MTVDLDAKRITKVKNTCVLGRAWFTEHAVEERPFAMIDGRKGSARKRSRRRQILAKAKFPMPTG